MVNGQHFCVVEQGTHLGQVKRLITHDLLAYIEWVVGVSEAVQQLVNDAVGHYSGEALVKELGQRDDSRLLHLRTRQLGASHTCGSVKSER